MLQSKDTGLVDGFSSWEIVSFVELCSDPIYKLPDAAEAAK